MTQDERGVVHKTLLRGYRLVWILASLCIGLIVIAVSASTAIDISAYRRTTGDVSNIFRNVSDELIFLQQRDLLDSTIYSVSRQVFRFAVCAESIAVEFRDARVNKTSKAEVHRLLDSATTFYDVKEAIVGFKDNESQVRVSLPFTLRYACMILDATAARCGFNKTFGLLKDNDPQVTVALDSCL